MLSVQNGGSVAGIRGADGLRLEATDLLLVDVPGAA
jgi:hypothetical protein